MSAHTRVFWDRPPLSVMVRKWVGHAEGEHLYCMAKGSCVVGNGVNAWCYFPKPQLEGSLSMGISITTWLLGSPLGPFWGKALINGEG